MAKKDRTGNRKTRDQRSKKRIPEMGYYLVVTDTEATLLLEKEKCVYFLMDYFQNMVYQYRDGDVK